jgi:hypothetical protein
VVDTVPRQLTPSQEKALLALSRQVQAQFELRKNLIELRATLESAGINRHVVGDARALQERK